MGVKVELIQDWGRRRKGLVLDMPLGAADILVNRRRLGRYVDGQQEAMVPVPAGVQQLVNAVSDVLAPQRRKGK